MDINTLIKYLNANGVHERNNKIDLPIEYEYKELTTNYFFNTEQVRYKVIYISFDTDSAARQDFDIYEQIKAYLRRYKFKFKETAHPYGGLWLDIMTPFDYDALDLYNTWTNTSVRTCDFLDHKYHAWAVKHDEQFNNHITKIMNYYGNLYMLDKANKLTLPCLSNKAVNDLELDLPF